MLMAEMRLTERLIRNFSNNVHKISAGHALFAVQLLNSFVRDLVIVFSPLKQRYDWSQSYLDNLRMGDGVAALIVLNLSSLEPKALRSLQVLSCLGIQIPVSLMAMLRGCECVPE